MSTPTAISATPLAPNAPAWHSADWPGWREPEPGFSDGQPPSILDNLDLDEYDEGPDNRRTALMAAATRYAGHMSHGAQDDAAYVLKLANEFLTWLDGPND